jgi:LPXTG-motif cell wall-anchored protein
MPGLLDTRASLRRLLGAAGLLVAAVLLLAPAALPEPAAAQAGCVPGGDDTFTPGDPGEPAPGGVVVGPGESCPETEPVAVEPAEELPPPPECERCPEPDKGATASVADSGETAATPVSAVQQLPYTGLDAEKAALMLGGLGLVAIGLGLGLRRRTYRV